MFSEVIGWVEGWGTMSGELHFPSQVYFAVWDEGSKRDEMLWREMSKESLGTVQYWSSM